MWAGLASWDDGASRVVIANVAKQSDCHREKILECFAVLAVTVWRKRVPPFARAQQMPQEPRFRVSAPSISSGAIAAQALDANCLRQVTITTAAVVTNSTQGLTNQPR
ncbi:hypothetical protein ABIC08_002541 [Bradyrhizobium sp. RT9b]